MTLLRKCFAAATLIVVATAKTKCHGKFTAVTAEDFTKHLNPGWNPGNTLDAIPTETSWGQPLLVPLTFENVKSKGFKGVRLPVTWADHFISDSPSWTVDPVWLQRVSDVVDMITSKEMYVIVNAHHDSWIWLDPTVAGANFTMMEEKFYRLWYQIGTTLGCKLSMVGFEALNEPSGSSASDAAFLTTLQEIFIRAINDATDFNAKRFIVLGGMGDSWVSAVQYFQRPAANVTNPWALTYHYYGPWEFTATAWGDTIWGSDSDKQSMENDISQARGNFSDVPIIIGEFAAPTGTTETAAHWKWYDFITATANKYNTTVMLWDASGSFERNSPSPWPDPTAIDIIMTGSNGISNALPDSTEDGGAVTQFSSGNLFHKLGDPITDINLPFLWNGNTLRTILGSGPCSVLRKTDYAVSGGNLTFKAAFLKKIFAPTSTPGFKGNLTLYFTTGADLQLKAYQWAPPILASNSSTVTADIAQNDLPIPITWQGKAQLATCKGQFSDGSYMVDTWTQWLGPMQQGRMTLGSQFDWNGENVIIKASALQVVLAGTMPAILSFEFFPRQPDNVANYTIYV